MCDLPTPFRDSACSSAFAGAADRAITERTGWSAIDWLLREHLPAWLDMELSGQGTRLRLAKPVANLQRLRAIAPLVAQAFIAAEEVLKPDMTDAQRAECWAAAWSPEWDRARKAADAVPEARILVSLASWAAAHAATASASTTTRATLHWDEMVAPVMDWTDNVDVEWDVQVDDNANAPLCQRGDRIVVRFDRRPRPGNLCLVEMLGHLFLRQFVPQPDGTFDARPANGDWDTFNSGAIPMRVVAAVTAMPAETEAL